MKELSYSDKLKSPKWQKKRLEIMKRDKFTCKLCGDTETQLHVHHLEYQNNCDPWEYENKSLITLCEDCHKIVEGYKIIGINISTINIFKTKGESSGCKLMFINYNDSHAIAFYDENSTIKFIYKFPREVIDNIRSFLNNPKIRK